MSKIAAILLCTLLAISIFGFGRIPEKETITGNMRTYSRMADGTWECDGHTYQYRLEITGRMPNAAADSSFVFLSNIPEISFKRAYMAAGFSSNMEDYFTPEEAVLVEMR